MTQNSVELLILAGFNRVLPVHTGLITWPIQKVARFGLSTGSRSDRFDRPAEPSFKTMLERVPRNSFCSGNRTQKEKKNKKKKYNLCRGLVDLKRDSPNLCMVIPHMHYFPLVLDIMKDRNIVMSIVNRFLNQFDCYFRIGITHQL